VAVSELFTGRLVKQVAVDVGGMKTWRTSVPGPCESAQVKIATRGWDLTRIFTQN